MIVIDPRNYQYDGEIDIEMERYFGSVNKNPEVVVDDTNTEQKTVRLQKKKKKRQGAKKKRGTKKTRGGGEWTNTHTFIHSKTKTCSDPEIRTRDR